MDKKFLYTTSFGRTILSAKREISRILHGKKKPADMDLYIGDLLWQYNGQPTISQYYLAARYLDAKLANEGIYDYSYCEELSKAYRGTANSKEKTIEYMKKFRDFLDVLETNGFNPTLGRFSVANDTRGLFFDDGTHRLAGLLLNKVKYIPVRIEDRSTKYDLNGKELLESSSIDKEVLAKLNSAIDEVREFYSFELFVLIQKEAINIVSEELSKYGTLEPIALSNKSVNEKVRSDETSPDVWNIYYKYKDIPCSTYHFSLDNGLFYKNKMLYSKVINEICSRIPLKNWGVIIPSISKSIEVENTLSRLNTTSWS